MLRAPVARLSEPWVARAAEKRRVLRVLAVLLSLALILPQEATSPGATATAPTTQPAPVSANEPRFEELANGLDVWLVPQPGDGRVSVQLWFASGSAHDPPGRPGFVDRLRDALARRVDPAPLCLAGATFESRTERDAVFFAWSGSSRLLSAMLAAESRRLRAAALSIADLPPAVPHGSPAEPELDALFFDLPPEAHQALLAAAFPKHPYGHAPSGPPSIAAPPTAEDAQAFASDWLTPAHGTLFIVGDFDAAAALAAARRHFDSPPSAPPPRRAPLPDLLPAESRLSVNGPPRLLLAWRAPAAGRYELTALRVLMHRLCNPVDGPLSRQLRTRADRAPQWAIAEARDHSLLVLSVTPPAAPGTEAEAESWNMDVERTVLAALHDAATDAPTPVELRRARALVGADLDFAYVDFHQRAVRIGWSEMTAGAIRAAEFERLRVATMPGQAVRDAAGRLMREPPVVMRVQPRSDPAPVAATPPRPPVLLDDGQLERWIGQAEQLRQEWTHQAPTRRPAAPPPRTIDPGRVAVRFVTSEPAHPARATVRSRVLAADPPLARVLLALGAQTRPPRFLEDYCSLHALRIRVRDGGISLEGPSDRLPQMTELLAELVAVPARDAERMRAALRDAPSAGADFVAAPNLPPAARADRLAAEWQALLPVDRTAGDLAARIARLDDAAQSAPGLTLDVESHHWTASLPDEIEQAWRDGVASESDGVPAAVAAATTAPTGTQATSTRDARGADAPWVIWIPGEERVELRAIVTAAPLEGTPALAPGFASLAALPPGVAPPGLPPPGTDAWAWAMRLQRDSSLVLGCSIFQGEVESRLDLLAALLSPRSPDPIREELLARLARLRADLDDLAATEMRRTAADREQSGGRRASGDAAAQLRALLVLGGDDALQPVLSRYGRLHVQRP